MVEEESCCDSSDRKNTVERKREREMVTEEASVNARYSHVNQRTDRRNVF